MKTRDVFPLLKETYNDWNEDKVPRLAAAFSFYTILSLAPLLIVVLGILGLVFGHEAARGQLEHQIQQLVGAESAKAIQAMLANAGKPASGIVATIVGTVTLLMGAGGVFGQLQDALNTIWGVMPKPGMGWLDMVKARFLSFSMVLGVGFLLMVSLVLSTGIAAAAKLVGDRIPGAPWVWESLNTVVSFGVFTLLFGLIYKVLPDAKLGWRDVGTGAVLTSVLFIIGKFAIGMYLGRGSIGSAYGAAGSLVVLLLWIYYSAQILFFGAEFTKVYAKKYGSKIVPTEDAIPVTAEARAEQGLKPATAGHGVEKPKPQKAYAVPIGPAPAGDRIQGMEGAIRTAGLIGAAIGLVVGLLRTNKQ